MIARRQRQMCIRDRAESIGWPSFFIVSTVLAVPALVMLWWLRQSVRALEVPRGGGAVDD